MLDQLYAGIDLLAALAAERTGRSPDDFAIRAWAGAVIGVVMATYQEAADSPMQEYLSTIDKAFTHLAAGLPLETS